MHNRIYAHLQSLTNDNYNDKLVLFFKVLFAKMIDPGTADILSVNNILHPFFIWENEDFWNGHVFILDSNYGNIKMLPIFVFSYTV